MQSGQTIKNQAMLDMSGIGHRYGARDVLHDVSVAVASGELVCLVGPSGCGKTTLLRLAAGLEDLQTGRVSVGGMTIAEGAAALAAEQRGVGFVFQDYALFPHLDVSANIAFGLSGRPVAERLARVAEMLGQIGLSAYASAFPHQLSGGQQQRVALARAMAPRPRVLLLDEPFSGLDLQLREQIRDDTLHVLKRSGAATLMVTHDPEEAMFMADRIVVLEAGRVAQDAAPDHVYSRPATAYVANLFGQANEVQGVVRLGMVATPFGMISAPDWPDDSRVRVLVRPEALRLKPATGDTQEYPARVVAARLLGRSSWVHLCLGAAGGTQRHLHVHARMPGRFLPAEGDILAIHLDPAQAFVFAMDEPK
jgi:iron(III) transport system ATP-binding protein